MELNGEAPVQDVDGAAAAFGGDGEVFEDTLFAFGLGIGVGIGVFGAPCEHVGDNLSADHAFVAADFAGAVILGMAFVVEAEAADLRAVADRESAFKTHAFQGPVFYPTGVVPALTFFEVGREGPGFEGIKRNRFHTGKVIGPRPGAGRSGSEGNSSEIAEVRRRAYETSRETQSLMQIFDGKCPLIRLCEFNAMPGSKLFCADEINNRHLKVDQIWKKMRKLRGKEWFGLKGMRVSNDSEE